MSELIALGRIGRSNQGVIDGAPRRQWDASDLASENVREDVRTLVGSARVEQLVLRGESRSEILAAAIIAAREAGRGVKLIASSPIDQLPPALLGEKWVNQQAGAEIIYTLVRRQRSNWKLAVKRVMDVVLSAGLLVILLPVLLGLALAVRLTSDGPIFYRWRVLGLYGRPFVGYKFRTMVRGADELKAELQHLNERSGPVFKIAKDPRVTPIGRRLRKYSLDELPQLWSVLIGDMSLVGPRPVFASEYRNFELWQMRKMSVKPGLTCIWQLDGRHRITDFADWARLDLQYIDAWSLWSDLTILARTPIAVIKGTGH